MNSLPIVLVAVVGLAALALDDLPEYDSARRPMKPPVVTPPALTPPAMTLAKAVPVEETLAPNEAVIAPAPAGRKAPTAPPTKRDVVTQRVETPRSRVDVEGRRLGRDERLQHAVMSAIKRAPNLTGQIAVEAKDAVVRLSGWTLTPGQSLRAEKAAARVEGVREVRNEIRPRMGVITS